MVLSGKLSTEAGIKSPADKFYNLFAKQLHDVQKHAERVHHAKLHEGDDWHEVESSLRHWTYLVDGEVHTCEERIEAIDDENKTVKWRLFGGTISPNYKTFTLIIQAIENNDGTASAKWTVEYEKLHEDIEPPNGWMEFLNTVTRDVDANLLKE